METTHAPRDGGGTGALRPEDLGIGRLFWAVRDAIIVGDADSGRIVLWNPAAERLFGYAAAQAVGRPLEILVPEPLKGRHRAGLASFATSGHGALVDAGAPVQLPAVHQDGHEITIELSLSPLDPESAPGRMVLAVIRDASERKRAEAQRERRARLVALRADVGAALAGGGTVPRTLERCAEAVVRHLDAAFARIWLLNEAAPELVLHASAGPSTDPDGEHGRIPLGQPTIGRIAASRRPHLTNDVLGDPDLNDRGWVSRERLVAFAGYPLLVEDRLVGVMALFARQPLDEDATEALAAVADTIAQGIERKRAQEALGRERRFLAAVLEDAADAIVACDAAGVLTLFNRAARVLHGIGPEPVPAATWPARFDLYTGDGARLLRPEEVPLLRALRGEAVHDAEMAIAPSTASGGCSWRADERCTDPAGTKLGAVVVMHDVTDQRRAEATRLQLTAEQAAREAAEAAEARYRGLFEGVADAILVADADRRYLDANAAATALLGYQRDDLLGLRVEDVVAVGPAWTEAEYARYVAEGRWRGELELRRKDGTLVPVEARATVVALPGGPLFLSALRDLTERRRLDRLRQDFLAMVTHDLRSPLTTVRLGAQLLRRRQAYRAASVDAILAQTDRMVRLIDDLADVVRLEAGVLPLRRGEVDLAALARDQAAAAQGQSARHAIGVAVPSDPVVGCWDRDRLAQILDNLLTNALKYCPEGGAVAVRVEADGGEARLSVSDQGPGIAREQQPRLFERFYRVDATGAGGLGLGLYIARMLVEAHGGKIWAESEPGRGSTFAVALPLPPRAARS
jgi:PAS domain S-box-containing protein